MTSLDHVSCVNLSEDSSMIWLVDKYSVVQLTLPPSNILRLLYY